MFANINVDEETNVEKLSSYLDKLSQIEHGIFLTITIISGLLGYEYYKHLAPTNCIVMDDIFEL